MYKPAIMGLLFCVSILLGSVFYVYITQIGLSVGSSRSKVLKSDEGCQDDWDDFDKHWREFDCELLREIHERDNSGKTY